MPEAENEWNGEIIWDEGVGQHLQAVLASSVRAFMAVADPEVRKVRVRVSSSGGVHQVWGFEPVE